MTGSLTIVGLGPARPEHLTVEALRLLEAAAAGRYRVYGLAHAREVAHAVVPDLRVRSLDALYGLPGVSRPVAYDALARTLARRAFEDGVDVMYLVAGSPLYINDAVLLLRQLCATRELPLRLVHGMSFVDLVLDRVYWTGHQGLQILSTWNLVRDGMRLSPDRPALLAQLGEFTQGGDALDESGSVHSLAGLRDVLLQSLPADHPVTILYSSGPPDYRSLARQVAVTDLAEAPVPVYSNLWVPAIDGPAIERRVAPPTDATLGERPS